MNVYRIVIFCLVFVVVGFKANAQRQTITPEPTREANVLHAKRFWRVIDLREKQNISAMWPRNPLVKVLYDATMNGKLRAYKNDSLASWLDLEQFHKLGSDTFLVRKLIDPNDDDNYIIDTLIERFNPVEKIKQLMLLEEVYFDAKTGQQRTQIIAIAPLYPQKIAGIDLGLIPLCWLKFYDRKDQETDCRDVLVNATMYNSGNPYHRLSYDDWFEQRQFSSVIIKESNPYDIFIMDDPEVKREGIIALIKAAYLREQKQNLEEDYYEH